MTDADPQLRFSKNYSDSDIRNDKHVTIMDVTRRTSIQRNSIHVVDVGTTRRTSAEAGSVRRDTGPRTSVQNVENHHDDDDDSSAEIDVSTDNGGVLAGSSRGSMQGIDFSRRGGQEKARVSKNKLFCTVTC
jgi:hypothetical protein